MGSKTAAEIRNKNIIINRFASTVLVIFKKPFCGGKAMATESKKSVQFVLLWCLFVCHLRKTQLMVHQVQVNLVEHTLKPKTGRE